MRGILLVEPSDPSRTINDIHECPLNRNNFDKGHSLFVYSARIKDLLNEGFISDLGLYGLPTDPFGEVRG